MDKVEILNEIDKIKKYVEASIWQEISLNRWELIKRLDAIKDVVCKLEADIEVIDGDGFIDFVVNFRYMDSVTGEPMDMTNYDDVHYELEMVDRKFIGISLCGPVVKWKENNDKSSS